MQAVALGDQSARSDHRQSTHPLLLLRADKADLIVFVFAAVTVAMFCVVFIFFFSLASTR